MRIIIFLLALPFVYMGFKHIIIGLRLWHNTAESTLHALKASVYMIAAATIMFSYRLF